MNQKNSILIEAIAGEASMNNEESTIQQTFDKWDKLSNRVSSPFIEKQELTANDESLISDIRFLLEQKVSRRIAALVLRDALASISLTALQRASLKS